MPGNDFFIGWAAELPAADRRFFLRAGVGLVVAASATAGLLAGLQRAPGDGHWDSELREWRGVLLATPYPVLLTRSDDGQWRSLLLVCQTKCGVAERVGALLGQPVVVSGSLIARGAHAMLAVADGDDAFRREPAAAFKTPATRVLGEVSVAGEILDSKCWFGAMRPASGKVHKACASLCIRSGIPAGLFVRDASGDTAMLTLTESGQQLGESTLAKVADPVEVTGSVYQRGDLRWLDTTAKAVKRLSGHA